MPAFGQDDRLIRLATPLGKDVLLPEAVAGFEAISELFNYRLEMVAEKHLTIDPKSIVGKTVTIGIQADDQGTERYINGVVASFEMTGGDDEFNNYRAWIVPGLWALTLNTNTRVFQNQTVVDVIKAVLGPYKISPKIETSADYIPIEYCTQYRETDFHFISRLMEQHGILYYFTHSDEDHVFTLQDDSSKLGDCEIQHEFRYAPEPGDSEGFYDFVIQEFNSRSALVTGEFATWDYSFIRYSRVGDDSMASSKGPLGVNGNEQYDYANSAAAYLKKIDSDSKIASLTKLFLNTRRDASDAGTVVVDGGSNAIPMATGFTFAISEYPQDALNTKYLLTRVEHNVQQLPPYRTRTAYPASPYANRFVAVPASIPYRPPLKTDKPVVHGMHTGQVVTMSGEDSFVDKYGRVCVQFWWDRQRKPNSHSPDNTLLRVAQTWAGKGWGTYFWPRTGDEVLIDFLEGDPDQPIVVGSLYNGVNMPKYDPAGQYTLSGVLTRSSKGGGEANANELRFEDLKGKEQIYLNAERDYDVHVENDWHTLVGNEQHTTIKSNQLEEVGGDSHRQVKGNQIEKIGANADSNIGGNQTASVSGDRQHKVGGNLKEKIGMDSNIDVGMNLNEKVGMNYSSKVGMNQYSEAGMNYDIKAGTQVYLNGGMSVVLEGGMGVCLSGPGGFISIGPEGVVISGTMVLINSGGAPIPGTPGTPQSPEAPQAPQAPKAPTFPGDNPYSQPKK